MGNLPTVLFLVFSLLFTRFMFNWYDIGLSETKAKQYDKVSGYYTHTDSYALNESIDMNEGSGYESKMNIWDLILHSKYDNVPNWLVYLIYTPFLVGIIYLLAPIPFKV